MDRTKFAKITSNAVYSVGTLIALYLVVISLFGFNGVINPNAMLPFSWKEQAFVFLAFGTIPMFLACMAVYKFNYIKNSTHKKRNFILIFLPGFICAIYALFVIGVIALGFMNSFVFSGGL